MSFTVAARGVSAGRGGGGGGGGWRTPAAPGARGWRSAAAPAAVPLAARLADLVAAARANGDGNGGNGGGAGAGSPARRSAAAAAGTAAEAALLAAHAPALRAVFEFYAAGALGERSASGEAWRLSLPAAGRLVRDAGLRDAAAAAGIGREAVDLAFSGVAGGADRRLGFGAFVRALAAVIPLL